MSYQFSTRLLPVVVLALAFLLTGCPNLGSFTFTEESPEQTVSGSPLGGLANLFPASIPLEIDLEQELQEQDASGARSVHLIELYFELTDDTEEENFDFLDNIELEVSSADSNSDLPRRDLAWRNPVPTGENRFEFDIDEEVDLKPYAEEGLRLRTTASGSAPNNDAKFRVVATFRVHVL